MTDDLGQGKYSENTREGKCFKKADRLKNVWWRIDHRKWKNAWGASSGWTPLPSVGHARISFLKV